MAVKKRISFAEKLRRIKKAGISREGFAERTENEEDPIKEVSERVEHIMQIIRSFKPNPVSMIFFVMYDIENNKIRNQIAKYLIKKGCVRVQKSIYLAETDRKVFNEIHNTLCEVQEVYDNNDSIFLVPVSTDLLRAMKMIGQNIDFDLIIDNKNTLFF